MVVVRSGKVLGMDNCSSSVANKSDPKDEDRISRHAQALAPVKSKIKTRSLRNKHKQFNRDPVFRFATQALNYFNQTSPQKYQLLKLGSFTPMTMPKCGLHHINFMAKRDDVAAAPEEMFFTELTNSLADGLIIRLCVSLGPINSISGVRLNGCYFCRDYNNVWHPKGGGFVRGGDTGYKTVQDICDINLNNAIPDREKHLPMLKQVSGSRELKKEGEYISEQVDDASLYATEALKFYNQLTPNYELVKPGFTTRVLLPKCTLFHVNFKAKETVPIAPEKLFFAELTSSSGVLSVNCCFALSPSELESGDETGDKTNGCYYCHEFNNVYHPLSGGFVRGGDSLYVSAKEFLC